MTTWYLILAFLFVLANGFFVAAEFAIVKVRSTQLTELAQAGSARARMARRLTRNLDAYLSAVSNRTNEIMKYLTLLSAVFLPLAFIVGFFGQNFEDLPGHPQWVHSDALMYVMLTLCLATPVVMFTWFRIRRWL